MFIVFDDMIADMLSNNKKRQPFVTELLIRGRKLILLVFNGQN